MDGVLIDAREWHYEAFNRALGLFGFEITKGEHLEFFDGLPTAKKLDFLSEKKGLPRELHALIGALKQDFTSEIVHRKCHPRFIHEHALNQLRQEGYKLAVASNSIEASVRLMLQKSGLIHHLDFFLSNQDVKEPKPSPEIYQKAIEKLGLDPKRVLVIEDNEYGIQSAESAGAHVMRVESPEGVTLENIRAFIVKLRDNTSA